MENILKFQDRICYFDYLVFGGSFPKRITGIKLPFNFIEPIPKELTDYCAKTNSKEYLNSDSYFSIEVIRDGNYYRKKPGNIINCLKNNLKHIDISLGEDPFYKEYSLYRTTMLLNKEEYMPSKDCRELLLEFYNSEFLPYNGNEYYHMVNNIINKIK
jgi:hypothetical protein